MYSELVLRLATLTFNISTCFRACSFYFSVKILVDNYYYPFDFQRRHRGHRDTLVENVSSQLLDHIKTNPQLQAVDFREIFESELFGLSMKEVSSLLSCLGRLSKYKRG